MDHLGKPISLDQRRAAARESAAKPSAPVIAAVRTFGVCISSPSAHIEFEDARGVRRKFIIPAADALEVGRRWSTGTFYEWLMRHAGEPLGGDGAGDA